MGVVTITVTAHDDDPYAAMQTSGSSSILVGLGLAALAPWLLRQLSVLARPVLGRTGARPPRGVQHPPARAPARRRAGPGHRAHRAAVGTLMLVGTDGRTLPALSGYDQDVADQSTCSTTWSSA